VGKVAEALSLPHGTGSRSAPPNPAKPEPKTSPGNPNLKTRNPKQHKSGKLKKKQSGRRRFEFFPKFGFSICFEIRVSDFGFK
jgi:hypothetical protein